MNRSGRELVGVPPDREISEFSVADLHDPSESDLIAEIVRHMKRGSPWTGRQKLRNHATGELIPVEFRDFPIRNPESATR